MNISGFDYEKIENPFDSSMERGGGLLGAPGMVDLGEAGKNIEKIIENTVSDVMDDESKLIQGQDLENLWISSWIKSRSYLPGKRGFMLDGKTGKIECGNLVVRGVGEIGGWNIDATRIYSNDDGLILDSSVPKIESGNYVSGYAGAGVHLSPNLLEVGNIACRGLIRTSVFQKDVISAMGGNFMVLGADVLEVDMTVLDNSTLTIKGTASFSIGDVLQIKDGTDDEWFEVSAVNGNTYTVLRDQDGQYAVDNCPAWKKGATVVNYGQSGDGGIFMTASESNAPYLSVFTHAGSPWTDLTTRLRLGKLDGFLGYPADGDKYGIAIGKTDEYLKYDPTNGMRIAGDITMLSDSLIAGNIVSKAIVLSIDAGEGDAYISGGAGLDYTNWTADKGFILGLDDSDSDKAKFFVGDYANNKYFSFDGANTDATGFRYIQKYTAGYAITSGNAVYYYEGKVYPTCAACPISCYKFIGFALENIAKDASGKIQILGETVVSLSADEIGYLSGNEAEASSDTSYSSTVKIAGTQELSRWVSTIATKEALTSVSVFLTKVGSPGDITVEIFDDAGTNAGPGARKMLLSKTIREAEVKVGVANEIRVYLDVPFVRTTSEGYHIVLSAPNGDTTSNYYDWHTSGTSGRGYSTTDGWTNNTYNVGDFLYRDYYHSQTLGQIQDEPLGVNSKRIYEVIKGTSSNKGLILPNSSKYWSKKITSLGNGGFPFTSGKIDYRIGFRPKIIQVHAICEKSTTTFSSDGYAYVGITENCIWIQYDDTKHEIDKILYLYSGATDYLTASLATGVSDLDNMKFTLDYAVDFNTNITEANTIIIIEAWG